MKFDDDEFFILYDDRLTLMDYARILTLPFRVGLALIAYLMIQLDNWRVRK